MSGCRKNCRHASLEICHRRTVLSAEAERMKFDLDQATSITSAVWPLKTLNGFAERA